MALLQSGVDIAVIALWLGDESIETTNAYLHANLAMKERALAKVLPLGTPFRRFQANDGCATWKGQSCRSGLPVIVEFTTVTAATDSDDRIGAANGPEHSRAFEPGGDEGLATRFDHA